MFEKLLKASDILSPSVSKLLQKAGLPVGTVFFKNKTNNKQIYIRFHFYTEEQELLRLTNPDNIHVEATYQGPRMNFL